MFPLRLYTMFLAITYFNYRKIVRVEYANKSAYCMNCLLYLKIKYKKKFYIEVYRKYIRVYYNEKCYYYLIYFSSIHYFQIYLQLKFFPLSM